MAKTLDEVRKDLDDIRFYYAQSEMFAKAERYIIPQSLKDKASAYSEAIKTAPAKLYALFVERYIFNSKCECIARKWGYTTDYIKILNKKLYAYFSETVTGI